MGEKIGDKFLIGLDIDNKKGPLDGVSKWKQLLLKHYGTDKTNIIKTPLQRTGNNGYHYLVLVNEEQLKKNWLFYYWNIY